MQDKYCSASQRIRNKEGRERVDIPDKSGVANKEVLEEYNEEEEGEDLYMTMQEINGCKAKDIKVSEDTVIVVRDYQGTLGELNLHVGDTIKDVKKYSSGWWMGTLNENMGWFPSNNVEGIKSKIVDGLVRRPVSEMLPATTSMNFSNVTAFMARSKSDSTRSLNRIMSKKCPGPLAAFDNIKLKRIASIKGDGDICGMAHLRGKIYVVCDECDRIIVFDARTFARVNELVIKQGQTLQSADIVSCNVLNCLYVYDASNSCIWRVKDDGNRANKWMQLGDKAYTNLTMSVSLSGHVLLLGDDPPTLHIYSGQDALLIHTIALPADMKRPRHAVETASGNFIISHGGWNSKRHRVCEVTKDGRVIRSYGDLEGGGDGHLNGPVHVTVDPITRCVYVADLNNRRILVLDPSLRLCRVLLEGSEDKRCDPLRVCYVADMGRLLVLPGTGCLDVYSVGK